MGLIVDSNERPVSSEQPPEPEAPAAGDTQGKPGMHDVRALPTGTLIFNLIRTTSDEMGLESQLHMHEMQRRAQKMVGEHPMIERMKEAHEMLVRTRFVMARELNERFKEIDKARCEACGIQIWEAEAPPEDDQPTPASTEEPLDADEFAPSDDPTPAPAQEG